METYGGGCTYMKSREWDFELLAQLLCAGKATYHIYFQPSQSTLTQSH